MSDLEEESPMPAKRPRLDNEGEVQDQADSADTDGDGDALRTSKELELGERLRNVMQCVVCLELPHPDESFQCAWGHILCEDCATRLMALAATTRRSAICPHCRTPISWAEITQNLVVGQMLWELPIECPDCEERMDYKSRENHMKNECRKRVVQCQFRSLGCTWERCHEDEAEHKDKCKYLNMSSDQILSALQAVDEREQFDTRSLHLCYKSLRAVRMVFEDLELRWPQTPATNSTEWKFHSSTIYVFENTWAVRSRMSMNTETEDNHCLSYSLKLLTTPHNTLLVKYFVTLPALFARKKQLNDVLYDLKENEFNAAGDKSDFWEVAVSCPKAIYRLLAMPCIKLRIWMLLH
ncbi:zinc finger TRAF-type-containing protein 1 homolog [Drosophila nasuta]|uniref:zinc finger TRAF-type-containing protein 1 homolog n=1 Tax=Drosophila nasuta TaxID=42062 RepID=UPI00295F199D|nr:zinc finger TRAF-type-containing protein 1 homolog [Drosophila nasuta]